MEQLERTGLLDTLGEEDVYPATAVFGESMMMAVHDAELWMGKDAVALGQQGPVDAVMVHVASHEEGLDWYEKAFPQAARVEVPESDFAYLDVDGVQLELVASDEKVSSGAAGSVVYWHTDDFEARLAFLQELGATLYRGPLEIGDGQMMCQVLDPWGNCIGIRGEKQET